MRALRQDDQDVPHLRVAPVLLPHRRRGPRAPQRRAPAGAPVRTGHCAAAASACAARALTGRRAARTQIFSVLYGIPAEEFELAAVQSCVDTIADVYGERSPEAGRYARAVIREGRDEDDPFLP